MNDILQKVNDVIAVNRLQYNLAVLSQSELVDFLWNHECIRDRLTKKEDIVNYLPENV